jgi:hypothetical protein
MDLHDACLVHLSEEQGDCRVLIIESRFGFYRTFGSQVILRNFQG